jgi:drug/metabolite transporter (DMT)-like permease
MSANLDDNDIERRRRHTAGAFDIRNVIGALLGIYGVVLLVLGLVSDDTGENTGDLHANVWAGIVLVVVAVVFIAWARVRPTVVDEKAVADKRAGEEGTPSA